MKLIQRVNLLENKKVIFWLNVVSIPLIALFFVLFSSISLLKKDAMSNELHWFAYVIILAGFFLLLTIHELIHGIFFKLFQPERKVKFGFKNGMAYATSPNSFYTKIQFSIICLAPFVLISLALFICYLSGWIPTSSFVFLSALHGAGCVGDFYLIYLVITAPKKAKIEDTEQGINLYQDMNT